MSRLVLHSVHCSCVRMAQVTSLFAVDGLSRLLLRLVSSPCHPCPLDAYTTLTGIDYARDRLREFSTSKKRSNSVLNIFRTGVTRVISKKGSSPCRCFHNIDCTRKKYRERALWCAQQTAEFAKQFQPGHSIFVGLAKDAIVGTSKRS